jgi:hypothetical protein
VVTEHGAGCVSRLCASRVGCCACATPASGPTRPTPTARACPRASTTGPAGRARYPDAPARTSLCPAAPQLRDPRRRPAPTAAPRQSGASAC